MARTIAKGPRGGDRQALEADRVSQALIGWECICQRAATQALHHRDRAIAVSCGTRLVGYVPDVDRAAIALDADGEIGRYEFRRLVFAAVSKTHIVEQRAFGGA
jgi:hypothetical protein